MIYPKDSKDKSGYCCLADIGVGDTLFFKQGDNNITFRTEGYNNSAYLTNGETEGTEAKVNCFIEDADVYLYNYGDYLNLVIYGPDENIIQFGYYPQSLVTDTELISNLNSLDETNMDPYGYYQYGNERYAKLIANYNASFPSGTQVNQGDTCWFLFQPINWRIVEFSNGKYTLLSDLLLDVSDYYSIYSGTDEQGKYANDYEHSYVRSFLNSGFYSVAFSLAERQKIVSTEIDNSTESTNNNMNPYACQNTTDKVSIMSFADLTNIDYGFAIGTEYSNTRTCRFSDYAMMKMGTQGAPDVGQYWTRSPYATASDCVNIVNDSGQLTNCMVGATAFIRPVIVITQL